MKCPNCNFDIDNKIINKHFASIGGKKLAESKSSEWKIERAKKAAFARWTKERKLKDQNK